jgi:hypothetical protein
MTQALLLLVAPIVFSLGSDPMLANECSISASIQPSRPTAIEREPVELVVTFQNSGPVPVRVAMAYPSLGGYGNPGLLLNYGGPPASANGTSNTIESIITIPANSSWTVKVYLQRYAPNPRIGSQRVFWSLQTPCVAENLRQVDLIVQHGSFVIETRSGRPEDLTNLARTYASALDSEDSRKRQEAVEALVVFPDPAVIPYLEQLMKSGYTEQAFDALRKFIGTAAARSVVLSALRSGDRPTVRAALQTLVAWRMPLDVAALDEMASTAPGPVQIEFLKYIQLIQDPNYMPIVNRLISSEDESVSQVARQVAAALASRQK